MFCFVFVPKVWDGKGGKGDAVLLRHQSDGVFAEAVLHVVEKVRLLVAGEGALEALVLEGLPRRPGDVVRLLRFPFFEEAHLPAAVLPGVCSRLLGSDQTRWP